MNNFFRIVPPVAKRGSDNLGSRLSYWVDIGSSLLLLATGIAVGLATNHQQPHWWLAVLFMTATFSFGVSVLLLRRRLVSQAAELDSETQLRLQGEEALRRREATLRLVFDGINDAIFLHTQGGKLLDVNETMLAMFGVSREQALGLSIVEDYSSRENDLEDLPRRWSLVRMGLHQFFPWKVRRPLTGEEFDAEVYLSRISLPEEEETAILATIRDITSRKKTERALLHAELAYRTIFENAMDAIFETHVSGHFTRANPATARLLGYDSPEELLRFVTDVSQVYADPEERKRLLSILKEQGTVQNYEMRFRRRDGSLRWASLSARANFDSAGALTTIDAVIQDATERKISEAELQERANLDTLTGLANRALFHQHLRTMYSQAKRSGRKFAVLYIDLDGFKEVNDSFGHQVGDQLLRQAGIRLSERLRETDLVARLGGDEFAALLWDVKDRESVEQLCEGLITALARVYTLDDTIEAKVSGSIGASIYPQDGEEPKLLLNRADQAMYAAKAGGKNRFCFFGQEGDRLGPV